MKSFITVFLAAGAAFLLVGSAAAEQWVDYSPAKGVWIKTYAHVEPSKIDDYLVGLKKTWVPGEEAMKKIGLLDNYQVQVAVNAETSGPNVVMLEHYVSMAALDPDKARDMALQREFESKFPKPVSEAEQMNRAKYRTLVSQEMWSVVDYSK